ncbi:serpin B5 [Hyperolius riggenbachi]|uniref:serpin B5 n=1 Tax=Hyperolius riggenbachi TaxID=752182 RepID=UPI0035A35C87
MENFRLANSSLAVGMLKMSGEKNGKDNFIISPLSMSCTLALAYKGSKGNTAAEIQKVLHFEKVNDYDFGFQTMSSDIAKMSSSSLLKVVKRLFVDNSHTCSKEFINATKKTYSSELEMIDIKCRAEEARNQINTSIKELTEGHIENVLEDGSLSESTNMVLLGAACLKGSWQYKFTDTKETDFQISKTETKPVQMMQQEARLAYRSLNELNLNILDIPFEGKQMNMLILLPKTIEDDTTGLEKLEQEMTYENYVNWSNPSMMANSKVKLCLPKFKIESCFNLKETLNSLGMKDAFDEAAADFSGMSDSKGLCISQAIYKAAIEINEDGSETADVSKERYLMPKTEFNADHPFYFIVRHNKTQSIILCGRYCGPS